ncbi:hypothetical protein IFM89_017799 [Coptis chinensis]|uniref:Uncharacterized protein n=1 Tax=Coptis chinensis TaxID=261450 RepID=A0A835H674_9MAGN|nr:hypothetical protein IFM89_017799 [Coptis chinensis]
MEGSESEEIFNSQNLNPQLFINEMLNAVDDVLDEGFEFFEEKAVEVLGEGIENELKEGSIGNMALRKAVLLRGTRQSDATEEEGNPVRCMIQEALAKRLGMWEKYCLNHCFTVPEGFSLPAAIFWPASGLVMKNTKLNFVVFWNLVFILGLIRKETSDDSMMGHDALSDAEVDNQLDSLREKLALAGKESEELQRKLHVMRKQSISNRCAESVTGALKQFEQTPVQDMFQEMVKRAAELRAGMEKLKNKRTVEIERTKTERIYNTNKDLSVLQYSKGFADVDLCDLQEIVAELR